jgi:nitroreductase
MKLMEALATRRAVRDFAPDRVGREVLNELMQAAALSPSYMNLQPWVFIVTDDPDAVARYGREAKQYLLRTMNRQSPFYGESDEIRAPQYQIFYNAPALIVICATRTDDGSLSEIGCAMAAQNLMLAAHAMGLGTCFVSQTLPWLNSAEGRKAIGMSREHHAVAPVVVGRASGAPLSPGRFAPAVRWLPEG